MRVLLVEDSVEMRDAITRRLRARGDMVHGASGVSEAEAYLAEGTYDVIVLDRGLGSEDGIDGLQRWRRDGQTAPVLVLTARTDVRDRVAGLAAGADDYLGKPFAMAELLARISALARRGRSYDTPVVTIGDLELDLSRREVRRQGVLLPLRVKEYAVLEMLARRRGRVVSRTELRSECWDGADARSNVEEATIASLRRKLGSPPLIHTRRGQGYILEEDERR